MDTTFAAVHLFKHLKGQVKALNECKPDDLRLLFLSLSVGQAGLVYKPEISSLYLLSVGITAWFDGLGFIF